MGFLANSGFSSSAGATANAGASWSQTATGLGAAGQLLQGIGGYQMSAYQAQVASNNADIARNNSTAAQLAGTYEEGVSKLKTGALIGQEKAAQGANSIDVGVGSAVAVRDSTQQLGNMDVAMIHYNAARQAYGEQTQAAAYDAQSQLDKLAGQGSLASGFFKAGSSFLSGASSLAARQAGYNLSTPPGGN